MKDSLKNFIDNNRDAFDDQEPSTKIWAGIDNALPGMKTKSLWHSVAIWRAAAILFMGLSVYFFINRQQSSLVPKQQAQSQREFSDLEAFYRDQIAQKAKLINDFDAVGEHDQFTQDFQKLDAMYQVLSEEMKSHPGEKVKDALILNLLVRVDLLNQQLKKLEDSRKKKTPAKSAEV